jgi:putative FmdB family regulatory protein
MPLFDFNCRACGHEFEALVRGTATPACPECKSEDLERMMSLPVVKSDTTRGMIKRETKRRDAKQAAEREYTQRQYEANHDD